MNPFFWVCNVAVVGMKVFPAILITQVKPVTYDWLLLCAESGNFGRRLYRACLGVPVMSVKPAGAGRQGGCYGPDLPGKYPSISDQNLRFRRELTFPCPLGHSYQLIPQLLAAAIPRFVFSLRFSRSIAATANRTGQVRFSQRI